MAIQTRPTTELEHQLVHTERGRRSGLPVVVAVHSTARGPALGGCRMRHYENWRAGLDDALRLAAGMTRKTAIAGLAFGGGKAVVALPPGAAPTGRERQDILWDVGDTVAGLGGRYVTGPDAGTGAEDMAVIAERTDHVLCTPQASGDSSPATAAAALACLRRTVAHVHGSADLTGRSVTILGLGQVGALLARGLVHAGARVVVADVDPAKQTLAALFGAAWADPREAISTTTDVLVPAALGLRLQANDLDALRCAAVVGPANDQLLDDSVAEALHRRGVLWAPDYLVGAGGVVHATAVEFDGADLAEATRRVDALADIWGTLLDQARDANTSPHGVAQNVVSARLSPSALDPHAG